VAEGGTADAASRAARRRAGFDHLGVLTDEGTPPRAKSLCLADLNGQRLHALPTLDALEQSALNVPLRRGGM
jgi:hypothetical protein